MNAKAPNGTPVGKGSLAVIPILLIAAAAHAEPARLGVPQPNIDDLRFYRACNRTAETQLLGFDEAGLCSRAFLRIKLAFVPAVTPEAFDRLPPRQKAEVNTLGYLRYLDWSKANARWLTTLDDPSPETAATD